MIPPAKFYRLDIQAQTRKLQRLTRACKRTLLETPQEKTAIDEVENLKCLIQHGLTEQNWKTQLQPNLFCLMESFAKCSVSDFSPGQVELHLRFLLQIDTLLAIQTGLEAGEWDLDPEIRRTVGQAPGLSVFCEDLRSPFNIGSIFRSAEAFGFSAIYLSSSCPQPGSPRLDRSAMSSETRIPWSQTSVTEILEKHRNLKDFRVFALELGGTSLNAFNFPPRGVVVVGSEELGVSHDVLEVCHASGGVVSIPLIGTKASLNVSVAFGILAQHWASRLR